MVEKNYEIIRVSKENAQETIERVKKKGILDPRRKIIEEEDEILIPVTKGGNDLQKDAKVRRRRKTPYEKIKESLDIDEDLKKNLPDRWEILGDIVLIKLPEPLKDHKEEVGEIYADVLGAKTVLLQGAIEGVERKPKVELIYGDETETVHIENEIKFKMDASRLMFSSGNIDERIRMSRVVNPGEIIVDMFAGIGYFTLPMAYHGSPERIYSLEINPISYDYLKENIEINGVNDLVEAWNGDNREFDKSDIADRVVMGYLHDTWRFIPKALDLLNGPGTIHYHTLVSDENFPENIDKELEENIERSFNIKEIQKIKSYAPHVFHVVADLDVL